MGEWMTYLTEMIADTPQKMVFSDCRDPQKVYQKILIERKNGFYQISKQTQKQVFHENISLAEAEQGELLSYCDTVLQMDFRQLNVWGSTMEFQMKKTKKGKILFHKAALSAAPKMGTQHNRQKNYLLPEGEIIAPLVDMGIFTKEGKIVRSMYDKYRQINKFIEILEDTISKVESEVLHVIDFGCGKSYLTFIVYYYLTQIKQRKVQMTGLDLKADVIAKCNQAAEKYGYTDLHFEVGDINGYHSDTPVDMVITLHACDTATDYALFNAVCWDAKVILSVPCCQHELCGQLQSETLAIFERYGIVKERTAALMTDAIRGNLLEACGYKTQLLEFVDLAHTPKNILIRAVKTAIPQKQKDKMLLEVEQLTRCFHLQPTLQSLLQNADKI